MILTDLQIWDGERLLDADTITIRGDRIHNVGTREGLAGEPQSISCGGATAVPGLIDAHVHLVLNPEHRSPPAADFDPPMQAMQLRATQMVRAGITTARDLGGGAWRELALRDAIAAGHTPGPRLICAGQPITCPGGHCHFWGGEAADSIAVQAVIERQLTHGVDLIKVMATGGRMTRGSDPLAPQFSVDILREIVAAASAAGLPVAAHCHGTPGIKAAAAAGVTSIEHCSWVGSQGWARDYQSAIAELILANGVWISPTVNRGWQRMLDANGAALERVRKSFQAMMRMGIPFMASTDAGIPGVYHHHLPQALAVFCAIAELSPEQTLRTATSAAARGLGLESITGRLQPGLAADILLVDGNPLTDLSALQRPVGIWAGGRAVLTPD